MTCDAHLGYTVGGVAAAWESWEGLGCMHLRVFGRVTAISLADLHAAGEAGG